jgi:predicted RNase H-like HicB family nuclease
MDYLAVMEKTGDKLSAYLSDVPGWMATGDAPEATLRLPSEALKLPFKSLTEDGSPLPAPSAHFQYIAMSY